MIGHAQQDGGVDRGQFGIGQPLGGRGQRREQPEPPRQHQRRQAHEADPPPQRAAGAVGQRLQRRRGLRQGDGGQQPQPEAAMRPAAIGARHGVVPTEVRRQSMPGGAAAALLRRALEHDGANDGVEPAADIGHALARPARGGEAAAGGLQQGDEGLPLGIRQRRPAVPGGEAGERVEEEAAPEFAAVDEIGRDQARGHWMFRAAGAEAAGHGLVLGGGTAENEPRI